LTPTNARIADLEIAPPLHSTAAGRSRQRSREQIAALEADRGRRHDGTDVIRGGDLVF